MLSRAHDIFFCMPHRRLLHVAGLYPATRHPAPRWCIQPLQKYPNLENVWLSPPPTPRGETKYLNVIIHVYFLLINLLRMHDFIRKHRIIFKRHRQTVRAFIINCTAPSYLADSICRVADVDCCHVPVCAREPQQLYCTACQAINPEPRIKVENI